MADRIPENQTEINAEVGRVETQFADSFAEMDTDRFIEQGVSIFRAAADGVPAVNEGADKAVKGVLEAVVKAEAPKPFMGERTAVAWRMYTAELLKRAAGNSGAELREVPIPGVPVLPYECGSSWTSQEAAEALEDYLILADSLLENFKIGGPDYIRDVAHEIRKSWLAHLIATQPGVDPAIHLKTAVSAASRYETAFTEMAEKGDASVLRRGLDGHDFSHVVEFVSLRSMEPNRRYSSRRRSQ